MVKAAIAATAGFLVVPVLLTAIVTTHTASRSSAPDHVPGIPDIVLDAYTRAAAHIPTLYPECAGMTWAVLAGIGHVESRHAEGRTFTPTGDVRPPILGPRLDGTGAGGNTTPHPDTDNGELDGDTAYDRAAGPMQFLPATWAAYGVDGNGDGAADPHNAYDAALTAAAYLCATAPGGAADFTDRSQLRAALLRYNASTDYVDDVITRIDTYTAMNPTTGSEVGSAEGQAAVEWALRQVGKPYVWGGTGPHGFDCSGLVMQAWAAVGVNIPRVTTDQYRTGSPVGLDELHPGDLLFYDTGAPGPPPAHVTMYVGNGQMINAPSTGKSIRTEPVVSDYYSPRFMGAVRPVK